MASQRPKHEEAKPERRRSTSERGGGEPLSDWTRSRLERTTGRSLSDVRVHGGSTGDAVAREHGVAALTAGSSIFVSRSIQNDEDVLLHEAAHTLQQDATRTSELGESDVIRLEQEASAVAKAAREGRPASVRGRVAADTPQGYETSKIPGAEKAAARIKAHWSQNALGAFAAADVEALRRDKRAYAILMNDLSFRDARKVRSMLEGSPGEDERRAMLRAIWRWAFVPRISGGTYLDHVLYTLESMTIRSRFLSIETSRSNGLKRLFESLSSDETHRLIPLLRAYSARYRNYGPALATLIHARHGPAKPEVGQHEFQQVGLWGWWSKSILTAGRTLGAFEDAAAAYSSAKMRRIPGVVFLERGRYWAYELTAPSVLEFTYSNVRYFREDNWSFLQVEPRVHGVVTLDGMVMRASTINDRANEKPVLSGEAGVRMAREDPLGGYAELLDSPLHASTQQTFFALFEAAMKDMALHVLEKSRVEVEKKRREYSWSDDFSVREMATIKSVARELADVDKKIRFAERTHSSIRMGTSSPDKPGYRTAADWRMVNEAANKLATLRSQRKRILKQYPMLQRVDSEHFVKLDNTKMLAELASQSTGILKDIASTREDVLDGDLHLWLVPGVVDATLTGLGIRIGSPRQKWIKDKVAQEKKSAKIKAIARAVFEIGLGIAAGLATGGLGTALTIGAAGLGVYDAVDTMSESFRNAAAANTALDPKQALVPGDLDVAWGSIALAWVGVGFDLPDVFKAIRAVGRAASVTEEAVDDVIKHLAGSDEALQKSMRDSTGFYKAGETISEASRKSMAARLGTDIEIADDLGDAVHIRYRVDARGEVHVTGARVGPYASLVDIAAHRRTVKLLERYSGLTGRIRRLLDRLRSFGRGAGRGNPFPPGTRAFESHLELEKLPRILAERRKRLGKAVTANDELALTADIRFLEEEIAKHQNVVDDMVLDPGAGFVAKPARRPASPKTPGIESVSPSDYKLVKIEPVPKKARDFPHIKPGVVYEFAGEHRVWRTKSGTLVHETIPGKSVRRREFQNELPLPKDMGYVRMHRGHILGRGTGFESPYGILYMPEHVNMALQNNGIEEMLREFADQMRRKGGVDTDGLFYHVVVESSAHPGTRRLKDITYRIDVSHGGERRRFFEFSIGVENKKTDPKVFFDSWANPDPAAVALMNIGDVPERIRKRMERIRRAIERRKNKK